MSVSIKKTGVIGVGGGTINYVEKTATGDIASFSDGANNIPCPSVLCTINPVQDLHGQDYPYPSGGGKNKLPFTGGKTHTEHGITFVVDSDGNTKVTSSGVSEGGSFFNYYTLKLPVGTYYLQAYVNGSIWTYASGGKFRLYVAYNGSGYNFGGTLEVTDASKDIVVYIQAMTGVTYNDTVQLMISEGSTAPTKWSPYSNICPITGHTELNLVHTGANVWDEEWENGYYNRTTGAKAGNTDTSYYRSKNFIPCLPNTTYYFVPPLVHASNYTWLGVLYYDANKVYLSSINTTTALKTTPANARYMTFYIEVGTSGSTYNNDISINYPSTDTSYHAYTGSTTTTDLGTTVYGGTLDVVSGVLTTDRGMIKLSDINWTAVTSNPPIFRGGLSSIPNIQVPPNNAVPTTAITESFGSYAYSPLSSSTIGKFAVSDAGSNRIVFIDDSVNTLEAFLQKYGNDILVYPLATPITTQLTPQEVKSLLGSNNIYHDCNGDIEVVYRTSSSTIPGTFIEDNQHKARIGKEFINSEDFIEI